MQVDRTVLAVRSLVRGRADAAAVPALAAVRALGPAQLLARPAFVAREAGQTPAHARLVAFGIRDTAARADGCKETEFGRSFYIKSIQ